MRLTLPCLLAAASLFGSLPSSAQQAPYFQQRVDTRIRVTLDDTAHLLHGYEEFTYTNNSPDTLRSLFLHLWPNAYAHDRTAFSEQQLENKKTAFYYSKQSQRGYIDSLRFTVNGRSATHSFHPDTPDIALLPLPAPLAPGASAVISTPFRVKIPKVFSRLGHTGQAYFISQWFPKPAVYDRDGWHPMPYLDQGEFFAEIGSYDVSITLPKNYVLMATGNCENADEAAWLDSLAAAPRPSDTLLKEGKPGSAAETKTVRFTESNVHDFAWFADKRWVVRKDTVRVPTTAEITTAWAAFLPSNAKAWDSAATKHLKDAVTHYSTYLGAYPYRTIKAVEGDLSAGGGMEYPTITIIDRGFGGTGLQTVIIHEAGHNWFQGILATNERVHPWLDEGFNTFFEHKTVAAVRRASDTGDKRSPGTIVVSGTEEKVLAQILATGEGQPLAGHSESFRNLNYGLDVYQKTGLYLRWLEGYMGEEAFSTAMHEYFQTWKHRHPGPDDFRAIVERHTTKRVDWFFDKAIHSPARPDFAIRRVTADGDSLRIRVRNRSGFTGPMEVRIKTGDTTVAASAWSDPFDGGAVMSLPRPDGWTRAEVGPATADARTTNNVWRKAGLLHRGGVALKPLLGFNGGSRERVWVLPALGANAYDGLMIGVLLHNAFTMPQSSLRFAAAPLYAFRSGGLVGTGSVGYFRYPERGPKEVAVQVDGKSFHYTDAAPEEGDRLDARYWKVAPSLALTFRERTARSPVVRQLMVKAFLIGEEGFRYFLNPSDSTYSPVLTAADHHNYGMLRYTHVNAQTVNPFSYAAEAQLGGAFAKLSVEGNLRIDYHRKGRALRVRGYAGKFFELTSLSGSASRYYLNSTVSGPYDYLYEGTFVGRNEQAGLGARQVAIREGGLKLPTPFYATPIGRSDNWLAAVNLSTDIPFSRIPVRVYFDASTFSKAPNLTPSGARVLYSGGVQFYLPPIEALSVYIPLINSGDYRDYLKSIHGNKAFLRSITFSLNLEKVNWLKATGGLLKLVQ